MNVFQHIRKEYGQDFVRDVRYCENLGRKVSRYRNHLTFSLSCKHRDIIPPSLQLKCPINTANARYIVNKARKSLLDERIRTTVNRIRTLKTAFEDAKHTIITRMNDNNDDATTRLSEHFSYSTRGEFESGKVHHKEKIARWVDKFKSRADTSKQSLNQSPDLSGGQLKRWVLNLSKRPLNDAETSVLEKGLNFAVTPSKLPTDDLIVAAEQACSLLETDEAHQLRPKLSSIISSAKPPTPNISSSESKALKALAKDDSILVLPADKGRCTVILDKGEYITKVETMLSDTSTYTRLNSDPTSKYKRKLVQKINKLLTEGKITKTQKDYLFPTSETTPRLYCTPKIHKKDNPLRPIVDYTGSIGYNLSRSLADLLSPLVGNTEHHLENTKDLVDTMKDFRLQDNETLVSFDVVSLFTNIPVEKALEVIKTKLESDKTLKRRTNLTVTDILDLLGFVLTTTYFKFNGNLYKQKFGTAMGSPVSPIVANLYMEHLEQKAIASASPDIKPRLWKRYVDDITAAIIIGTLKELSDHLNNADETGHIKFTCEESVDGEIAMLDVKLKRQEDGSLHMDVYRKKSHTNQYLHFSSHHPTIHKMGVIRTLLDRANTVCTTTVDKESEEKTVLQALTSCGYPRWTFDKVKRSLSAKSKTTSTKTQTNRNAKSKIKSEGSVIVPYVRGLSERFARVLRTHNIATCFKPQQTIRSLLVHPKDKLERDQISGCVYKIGCANCPSSYIGETGRQFSYRLKEHRQDVESHDSKGVSTRACRSSNSAEEHKSAITDHMTQHNHVPNWKGASILTREDVWKKRSIREAIWIRRHPNNMNRDEGGYKLSRVYDNIIRQTGTPPPPTVSRRGGRF